MKRINVLGLSLVSILALTACGGGSSTNDVKTGTAYYLDSAVAGVNYKCGNREGITGVDGSFTFEEGEGCTFYLGDIKLRDMDKAQLIDGAKIVEEDIKVATLLQTLDSDGNPDNGITIKEEVVEAMATALSENGGDGTLPDTVTELEVLVASLEQVEGYDGHVVSESDAQTHLDGTKTEVTKALLAEKTFYVVGEDGEDNQVVLFQLTVDKDATMFTSYKEDGTKSDESPISITGNKLVFTDDNDGSYTLISQADGYIFADDRNADGSKDAIGHRLYTSKADAQAYYDSLSGGDDNTQTEAITQFSTEWLNGKTLYNLYDEDDGWHIAVVSFTQDTMSGYDIDDSDESASVAYTITSDGYISYMEDENDDGTKEEHIIAISSSNTTFMTLCWTKPEHLSECREEAQAGNEDEYFYYTLEDAQTARNSK